MSAYIVPDKQVILIAALHWGSIKGEIDLEAVCDIADKLLKENYKSYNCRYEDVGFELIDRSKVTKERLIQLVYSCVPLQILKHCLNYIYQSDNHEEWKTSKARDIVESVISSNISKLEGYDALKWGMDE